MPKNRRKYKTYLNGCLIHMAYTLKEAEDYVKETHGWGIEVGGSNKIVIKNSKGNPVREYQSE